MSDQELSSDMSLIDDPSAKKHEAWPAFVRNMKGRAYGREMLNSAWSSFRAGWDAAPVAGCDKCMVSTDRIKSLCIGSHLLGRFCAGCMAELADDIKNAREST